MIFFLSLVDSKDLITSKKTVRRVVFSCSWYISSVFMNVSYGRIVFSDFLNIFREKGLLQIIWINYHYMIVTNG